MQQLRMEDVKNTITLDTDAFSRAGNFYDTYMGVKTIYHEVGFHGSYNEVDFVLNKKTSVENFRNTGTLTVFDLERSPYGQRGVGVLNAVQNMPRVQSLKGARKYTLPKIRGLIYSEFNE